MHGNPSRDLPVALIADPGDAAFDTGHADFARAITAYERTRTLADLAAVPLRADHPGMTLYVLAPLTAGALAAVREAGGVAYGQGVAVLHALRAVVTHARVAPDGAVSGERAAVERLSDKHGRPLDGVAPYAVLDRLQEEEGGQAIQELGALAIERATVSPRKLAPFTLPSPLKPPA